MDKFGRPVQFDVSKKKKTVTTCFGGVCTIIFVFTFFVLMFKQINVLLFQGLSKIYISEYIIDMDHFGEHTMMDF